MMLVALGDKHCAAHPPCRYTKSNDRGAQRAQAERVQNVASALPDSAHALQSSAQTEATHLDADIASELIASRVTTRPVETVVAVLAATREGASINAAAKAVGVVIDGGR
jgi:hypothetical protein